LAEETGGKVSDVLGRMRHLARSSYHYLFPATVLRRYLNKHDDDEVEMDHLDILVDSHRGAIDVGANLGRYSMPLAALATHVWAFEPHPRLAWILRKSLPVNVTVMQAAVSNRRGSIELRVPLKQDQPVESLATLENLQTDGVHRVIKVPVTTLDNLSERDVGFVKIDVEGHEISVVEGGRKLLATQHPVILVEADEHHRAGTTAALFRLMASLEYPGLFLWRDKVLDVEAFNPQEMQKREDLRTETPRKQCSYVNNFIFAPAGIAFSTLRARLTERVGLRPGPGLR
jgi:FkbM family methyltransferase